jgi:hypothetical protein
MADRIWVSGNPWVLHPTGAGSGAFLHPWPKPEPDPRRTGFGCGFCFSPADALEIRKNLKPERNPKNLKKLETWKKPEKTQNK